MDEIRHLLPARKQTRCPREDPALMRLHVHLHRVYFDDVHGAPSKNNINVGNGALKCTNINYLTAKCTNILRVGMEINGLI